MKSLDTLQIIMRTLITCLIMTALTVPMHDSLLAADFANDEQDTASVIDADQDDGLYADEELDAAGNSTRDALLIYATAGVLVVGTILGLATVFKRLELIQMRHNMHKMQRNLHQHMDDYTNKLDVPDIDDMDIQQLQAVQRVLTAMMNNSSTNSGYEELIVLQDQVSQRIDQLSR
ncbi:MAG: hypothetical protein OYH77_04100 [Pseudomonadota bacterium]|nr:hypothetical protein [Pseudomonadota bacterium]